MIRRFKNNEEYNVFTNNGQNLVSGDLYWIDGVGCYFLTNNIDGELKRYDALDEIPPEYIIPTGNVEITANGEDINVHDYATATVNVQPDLTTETITENGTYAPQNADGFSSVTVNVASGGKNYIVEGTEYDPTATYSGAFMALQQIVTANIPSGFTSIGGNAFNNCTSLTSVTIPDSVTTISSNAFNSCRSLTSVTIPNSVINISSNAFQDCSSLTSVTIGNGVTSIGGSAFYGCTALASVTIPNSVTSIGSYAFESCTGLRTVTIPNSVTSIGSSAFENCYHLTSVTINATTPPTLTDYNAFNFTNNCPIYVPAESVEAYKAATNWSTHADRIQAIPTA